MRHTRRNVLGGAALLGALILAVPACGSDTDSSDAGSTATTEASGTTGSGPLVGTFEITAGQCSGTTVSGSYFRMVSSGGTVAAGPYVPNADSTCTGDTAYSPLSPGTDGGLVTGSYQEQPDPPFDATQNGLAGGIVKPLKFFGVDFAASTNPTDPESGDAVPAPSIAVADGTLSGAVAAMTVAWNGQQFNQGAPKPDGSSPGITVAPTGTYDPATGKYVLEWASQIVGGPFDGYTGVWHLEGTFKAA